MLSKEEIEKAYWEGYITKQNEAMEICKQCKYVKKSKELEAREQKLIEKLEEDIKILDNEERITGELVCKAVEAVYAQKLLAILKGEKEVCN